MDRYEIQILDNYENPTYADGYAGGMYGQHPPAVNACREPGAWQTHDIVWTAPRFDGDDLAAPARVTLLHNGVLVQDDTELIETTRNREVGEYSPPSDSAVSRSGSSRGPTERARLDRPTPFTMGTMRVGIPRRAQARPAGSVRGPSARSVAVRGGTRY